MSKPHPHTDRLMALSEALTSDPETEFCIVIVKARGEEACIAGIRTEKKELTMATMAQVVRHVHRNAKAVAQAIKALGSALAYAETIDPMNNEPPCQCPGCRALRGEAPLPAQQEKPSDRSHIN